MVAHGNVVFFHILSTWLKPAIGIVGTCVFAEEFLAVVNDMGVDAHFHLRPTLASSRRG